MPSDLSGEEHGAAAPSHPPPGHPAPPFPAHGSASCPARVRAPQVTVLNYRRVLAWFHAYGDRAEHRLGHEDEDEDFDPETGKFNQKVREAGVLHAATAHTTAEYY